MTATTGDPRDALPPRDFGPRDIRPSVALPRSYLSGAAIFGLCAILAVVLFLMLDARRRALLTARDRPVATAQLPAPPPPLSLPPALPPPRAEPVIIRVPAPPPRVEVSHTPPPVPSFQPPPAFPLQPPIARPVERANDAAPAMVVDQTIAGSSSAATGPAPAGTAPGNPRDPAIAANGEDAVRATLIRNRAALIPQGALIAAVLETPLNSDRPGLARAIISRDARSFDGTRVLIPRGSRLIGEFRATANANQRRVLVTWTRLIRPDGVAIRIGSPATDALGGAGIAGSVNTHFFERFTNAVLQSALTIGTEVASRSASRGAGSVFVGVPGQLNSVGQQLLPNINARTTVKVREGAEIAIFVARDLDFGGTPPVR